MTSKLQYAINCIPLGDPNWKDAVVELAEARGLLAQAELVLGYATPSSLMLDKGKDSIHALIQKIHEYMERTKE